VQEGAQGGLGALGRVLAPLCAEPADARRLVEHCRVLVPVLAAVRDPAEEDLPQDLTLGGASLTVQEEVLQHTVY
jgi:hypothetical protein